MEITAAQFLAFNAALLAAMASPGPALMMALRATLTGGRRAGIATGAGLATVASLWTLAALFGLDRIFALFPVAYTAFRLAGAAYLLWIAVQAWRHASAPPDHTAPPQRHRAYLGGVLVNLGNPKSVLFAAAILVVIFPAGPSPAAMAAVTLNHFAIELAVYTLLSLALGHERVRGRYLRAKPLLDRVSAAILGALGLRLLVAR